MQAHSSKNIYIVELFIKWKIHFIVTTVVSIAVSVFLSEWLIQPKYKSFALVYPSGIIPYGSESPSQQMLEVFRATDVRNEVCKKINLAAHYEIDTVEKSGADKLISCYISNVKICLTQLGSVKVSAFDKDPNVACEIVNSIIDAFNLKMQTLHRDKTKEQFTIIKNELTIKKHQVDSLNAILEELRVKYQIFDYDKQSEEVTKAYLNALSFGKPVTNLKDIDVLMRNLEEKGGEYCEVKKVFDNTLQSYVDIQSEYNYALKEMRKEITYTNIVTRPSPAYGKSYPVTWLITLISVLSANLLLFLIILSINNRKNKPTSPAI